MKLRLMSAALAAAAVFASATASAAVLRGDTVVEVTLDLAAAGLTPSLLGGATANSSGFLNFPITGGNLAAGRIEHENSGVRLTAGERSIDLENFIIDISDPVNGRILADVSASNGTVASDAAIFSFDLTTSPDPFDLANPTIGLFFTLLAAQVLDLVFAGDGQTLGLSGVQFGEAATAPAEIPLPAAAWLFLAGLGALAARGKGKRIAELA